MNTSFQIWDKNGNSLYGPVEGNTLWSGFGGLCETSNDGDPVVLYDHLADRWFMSQFAITAPSSGYYQCIAVSQTGDPTGSWYRYAFLISTTKMNDYPKFGVWPDGYYMSINQFDSSDAWAGAGAVAFERSRMLNGLSAQTLYFDLYSVNVNFGGMLPTHLNGAPPPAGAPNLFIEMDDNAWWGTSDRLSIWKFQVDWTTPANSTLGLSGDPNNTLNTAAFTTALSDVSQPGTAQRLDVLSDRLMYRLQYRNFGDHESLVVNHTIRGGSGQAAIRWYEVRDPGGTPVIYQQGTYSPDANSRWMGSIAMDQHGNMALGYSVASASVYPSIRITGRLATDALGTLPLGETNIITGTGVQTGTAGRWGDYSTMSVDPVDGCTFWYTQEYVATTGSTTWRTRIASFKYPSCTPRALQGTVLNSFTSAPIVGAEISAVTSSTHPFTTTSTAGGVYSLILPVGAYTVTASASGFLPSSISGISISSTITTTQAFTLSPNNGSPTATSTATATATATPTATFGNNVFLPLVLKAYTPSW